MHKCSQRRQSFRHPNLQGKKMRARKRSPDCFHDENDMQCTISLCCSLFSNWKGFSSFWSPHCFGVFCEVLSFVKFSFEKIFKTKPIHNIQCPCIFRLGVCVLLFYGNVTEVLCCNSSPSHLCNRCGLYRLQIQNTVKHKKM